MWIIDYNGESGISGPPSALLFYTERLSIQSAKPNFTFHHVRVTVTDTQCSDHTLFSPVIHMLLPVSPEGT